MPQSFKKDYTGEKFGNWIVIRWDEEKSKISRDNYWIAECQCENKTHRSCKISHLKEMTDKSSCQHCYINRKRLKRQNVYIEHDDYIEVMLSNVNKSFKISKEDFELVKNTTWCDRYGYVYSSSKGRLHRLILNMGDSELQVDHINEDKLDNRRENLRIATNAENNRNITIKSNNTSGVRGVSWDKGSRKWRAYITFNGNTEYLGYYEDLEEAKKSRLNAEKKYFREFAPQN